MYELKADDKVSEDRPGGIDAVSGVTLKENDNSSKLVESKGSEVIKNALGMSNVVDRSNVG